MKKLISIVMIACLTMSLFVGCGNASNTNQTSSNSSDDSQSQDTLSFKVMTVNFGEAPTGKLIQEAWLSEMEKLMGKKLDIKFEFVNRADYKEKLKIMLASGDLPDLITSWGLTQDEIKQYGDSGTFVDVSSYLDQLPNYKKYIDEAPESKNNIFTKDGKLFGFYTIETNWQLYSGGSNYISYASAFRKDIFDKNGIEIPKTVEDVYNAAKKLKEIYPDQYPIMQMEEWQPPIKMLLSANHISGSYTSSTFNGTYYNGTQHVYGPIQEGYKEALVEMNKWYKEGLISPDYFTQTQAEGKSNIASNSGMIIPASWDGYPAEWAVTYPDQDWVLVPGIENSKYGKPWIYSQGFKDDVRISGPNAVLVNAKSKNIDELLQFMDYQMSDSIKNLLTWGIEGETYTEEDGAKKYIDSIVADQANEMPKYGLGTGTCRSGIFPQIQDQEAWLEFAQKGKIFVDGAVTDLTVPEFIKQKFNIEQAEAGSTITKEPITTADAEEYASIMTPINTYAAEQMAAFISGGRSFDEWDQYVDEINSMGDIPRAMSIYDSSVVGSKN